jgi:hypothetical protein
MATAAKPTAPPPPAGAARPGKHDIIIYSHSPILYCWPVWLVGFCLALVTYLDGGRLAYVPPGAQIQGTAIVLPEAAPADVPQERLARNPYLGTWFFITLLVVFLASNVQVRGLWEWITVLAIMVAVLAVLQFGLLGRLADWFRLLHIHINLAGYLFLSSSLLVIWLLSVFVFDRRTYMAFSAGQVRIRDAIGQAEKVYDVTNMTFQVQPNVFLRHHILGLYGAGDLLVQTGGAHPEVLEWPNVLFARSRLRKIQELIKERPVVS